jgi:prepilin-type N-terminal cleavage/methylation domain-containing protein
MRRRPGFTIVELLVALALILFIMAILSQAFISATSTFRNLKALGDMMTKLRATTQLLHSDLSADHFNGKRRLSDQDFFFYGPPQQGYFQIYQGSDPTVPGNPSVLEGTDLNGFNSYRCVDQTLAFTIKVRGNQLGDFLTANAPAQLLAASPSFGPPEARLQSNSYSYQWAEVAWFLKPSINPATGKQDVTAADPITGAAGVPLYTLYRRQRLAVPENSLVNPAIPASQLPNCLELSCWPNGDPKQASTNLYFNNPTDLTVPTRRFGGGVPTAFTTLAQDVALLKPANAAALAGSDIQLTDVVSFEVRVNNPDFPFFFFFFSNNSVDPFVTLFDPSLSFFRTGNPLFGNAMVYDTWSTVVDGLSDYSQALQFFFFDFGQQATSITMPMWDGFSAPNVQALQITLRIWDAKTNQTRQVTIVQAM